MSALPCAPCKHTTASSLCSSDAESCAVRLGGTPHPRSSLKDLGAHIIAISNFSACDLSSSCETNRLQLRSPGFSFQLAAAEPSQVWRIWPVGIPGAPGGCTGGAFLLECHPSGLHVFSLSKQLLKMGIYLDSCSTCTVSPPACRHLLRP